MIDKTTAEHYTWGVSCDGWRLVNRYDLSVIQERMPPNTREARHLHQQARQFFYILSGTATMEVDGNVETISPGQGIEILPGQAHQIANNGDTDLEFIVTSQPTTTGDRILL